MDHEFEASLGYEVRPYLKKKKKCWGQVCVLGYNKYLGDGALGSGFASQPGVGK